VLEAILALSIVMGLAVVTQGALRQSLRLAKNHEAEWIAVELARLHLASLRASGYEVLRSADGNYRQHGHPEVSYKLFVRDTVPKTLADLRLQVSWRDETGPRDLIVDSAISTRILRPTAASGGSK